MSDSQCGLLARPLVETEAQPEPVALTGIAVRARVKGLVSRVQVTQSYENREKVPVETVYVFPLEEGSAVCGFSVTIDGRRLEGRVKPRDEAFDDYDEALAAGHGAFLLDQERPNVFTASVGNLLPGQKVEIRIDYVAELHWQDRAVRLMIPSTVSPRYVPSHRQNFEGLTDGDRVNPPVTPEDPGYALELRVEADLHAPLRAVESPSHKIRSEVDGARATVTLSGGQAALDRDFVLLLEAAEPARPVARIVRDANGERFVAASFRPQIDVRREPVEIVFLVDCSGSMGGPSIEDAQRALRLCLQGMAPGDRFDIVRFGSTHESLFGKSRVYDDASLRRAGALLDGLAADLGGTEVLEPLNEVLARPAVKGLRRRIVLITDGQVSNEDEVLALARRHRRSTQIFSFGVGHGASEFLVRGVARASGGAAELVSPGESIEDKVLRHFRRLTLPAGEPIRIEWEGLRVEEPTPAEPAALYPGDWIHCIARVSEGEVGRVRLSGTIGETAVEAVAEIDEADAEPDDVVPILWARRRIREIEETPARLEGAGSAQADRHRGRVERQNAKLEQELVRLGTSYGLLSSATSYVVVDERPEGEQATERAELRRIPVALTHGWGGLDALLGAVSAMMTPQATSLARASRRRSPDLGEFFLCMRDSDAASGELTPLRRPTAKRQADPDWELICAQSAEGYWTLDEAIADRWGVDLEMLERSAATSGHPQGARLLATLLVLHLLGERPVPASWQPALDKARDWVGAQTAGRTPPDGAESWQAWARELVG